MEHGFKRYTVLLVLITIVRIHWTCYTLKSEVDVLVLLNFGLLQLINLVFKPMLIILDKHKHKVYNVIKKNVRNIEK